MVSTFTAKKFSVMGYDEASPVSPPKVLLVGPSFSGDGAEGRFSNISTHLFGGKNDVAVLVSSDPLEQNIAGKVIHLGWSGRLSYAKSVWLLIHWIKRERYDLLMAFGLFPSAVSIIAKFFVVDDTKIIINEITRPKMATASSKGWRSLLYNVLRRCLYRRSALITANLIDGLRETCELAGLPIERGVRVVNVIDSSCLQ